ncbi:TM2 domain-containing protein [Rapidithrix thailandica]|uniref:TM2 domain-containing protein n=1 Tax=Rapidithrix thailandica TaxID=413964 RepID=A0AAW9S7Q5_9BACT
MNHNLIRMLPGIEGEELIYLQNLTEELTESELQTFISIYSGKRVRSDNLLIGSIVGLFGFAGVQRFMIGQIGMGILHFFTAGLCMVGTIIDLINHKKMATEHNLKIASETLHMVRMLNG